MAFISIFDVLGPNMIGPSSSHTAGACVISFLARKMIGGNPKKVEFILYGPVFRRSTMKFPTFQIFSKLFNFIQFF